MKKWFEREFKRSANEILRSKRPEGRDGAKPASQWYCLKTALLVGATVLAAGCASTTITEYDEAGNVVKVTESDESAMAIAAQSITTKDNMLHASGWAVGVQPSAGTTSQPKVGLMTNIAPPKVRSTNSRSVFVGFSLSSNAEKRMAKKGESLLRMDASEMFSRSIA